MRSFLAAIFAIFASTSTWAQTVCPTHQINAINRGQSTWMAGPNFPGYTLEELSRRNGARLDPNRQLPLKTPEPVPDIPDTFDARANWPNCESTSAIRDQGNCGSCWAFGAAEAMSDRLCIASHGAVKFEYSPEDILACCTNCGSGCEGGFSAQAWAFWVSNGVVSGGDYNSNRGCQPYSKSAHEDNVTPKCETTCLNTAHNVTYNEDKRFGTSNYRISANVTHIQTEIMTNGPVEGVFTVYEDFFCYRTGRYGF
ncbi:Peptidase C1 and/or Propeptide C1 domain containing protein, partial [Asbolus verrucosus]